MAKIVFTGYLVRRPLGGFAWQTANYLLGFRALGHDVWFYEDTGMWNCRDAYNPITNEFSRSYEHGIATTANFLSRIGLGDRWVFVDVDRGIKYGPAGSCINSLLKQVDLLVSFGPVNRLPAELCWGKPSVFIDADPVFTQLKLENRDSGLRAILDAHNSHFTFGENISNSGSNLPTGGYHWHPTRQPVAMEHWQNPGPPGTTYTTVGTWNSRGREMEYHGETFTWDKRTEWCRFLDLPSRTNNRFELATDIDSVRGDRELLTAHGWQVVDPMCVSADPWRYRDYLRSSRGEFTVAKDMNVRLRSGWFSDRAACYLAAGRPVIEQDTGFGDVLPLGPGLHAFKTIDEAAEAVDMIEHDYDKASAHASEVAREYFAANRVLSSMLALAG